MVEGESSEGPERTWQQLLDENENAIRDAAEAARQRAEALKNRTPDAARALYQAAQNPRLAQLLEFTEDPTQGIDIFTSEPHEKGNRAEIRIVRPEDTRLGQGARTNADTGHRLEVLRTGNPLLVVTRNRQPTDTRSEDLNEGIFGKAQNDHLELLYPQGLNVGDAQRRYETTIPLSVVLNHAPFEGVTAATVNERIGAFVSAAVAKLPATGGAAPQV